MADFTRDIDGLKKLLSEVCAAHCESGLNTLKFHFLDHLVEFLEIFCTLQLLDTSGFELYNVNVKLGHRSTSERHFSGTERTVRDMEKLNMSGKVVGKKM